MPVRMKSRQASDLDRSTTRSRQVVILSHCQVGTLCPVTFISKYPVTLTIEYSVKLVNGHFLTLESGYHVTN